MVQKTTRPVPKAASRGRGRPRAFEADTALAQAMDVFWSDGFAATSLDDISAATGLNRPSLYGAFGDKRALYLQAYGQYRKRMNEVFAPLFAAREPLRTKLTRILTAALDLYLSGPDGPRGCFTVLSAASEAIADPDLHSLVSEAIDGDRSGVRPPVRRCARGGRIAGGAPIRAGSRAWRRRPSIRCRSGRAPAFRALRSCRSSTTR